MSKEQTKEPAPAIRLVRIKYTGPHLGQGPAIHQMTITDLGRDVPVALEGWGLSFRGPAVFLISPAGWSHGKALRDCNPKGKVRAIGPIPLGNMLCEWEGDDGTLIDKIQRFDTGPLMRPAPPASESAALDPKEMGDP